VISGFHYEIDENCALLCYYAVSSDNFFPKFWNNLKVPSSGGQALTPEDRLSRNAGKKLPLLAAQKTRKLQFPSCHTIVFIMT